MRETLLRALKDGYIGDRARATANIEVYLTNPAGIGEHPDIIAAIDEELSKVAEAEEKLDMIVKHFDARNNEWL